MSRIIINDWLAWGNLIKTWATGRPFSTGKLYQRPQTLDELKAQLSETGAGSIPDWVVDFELIEWSEERLVIQLPSREAILNGEALLKAGRPCPLPTFYPGDLVDGAGTNAPGAQLAFHTMRTGERAISDFG
jgi:hypothetical protein